ncbi:alpha/beta fold hydrolase [Mucilaginibacter sp. FT3.2]|uniref:alpha/beta fold hydrolase n=1 Tax=Mucilaginibacter sp. FT3.2 TaxID=2723090 RepID=UPI001615BC8C|nr:alpha/beta hydrolase [Mucilaginibacter sp. FT3.2]MBB6233247.1 pimeloyl-ACP methyl ester carboxylesterase [Mucilaginibacter sp. FT3.2]
MKKLKLLHRHILALENKQDLDLTAMLWQLICYSPKMSPRLQQQQLLDEAAKFTLQVDDSHFAKASLKFNGFIWGDGSRKVLITHGWGSKAIDFDEVITALKLVDDIQIIAFDAPGNASSEGELSNLILFAKAAEAVINKYGMPEVMIGHSLGAMANVIAINETGIKPALQISIAPLIKLKENFKATMNGAEVPASAQEQFFESFRMLFGMDASYFDINDKHIADAAEKHWLAFDREDKISPYSYLQEFLGVNPGIITAEYANLGHERIIKDASVVEDIVRLVKISL